jgi:hypothetical protein
MALTTLTGAARPLYHRPRLAASPARPIGRLYRWVAPPLREVARLSPKRAGSSSAVESDFGTILNTVTYRLRVVWWVAELRRSVLCGLVAGCIVSVLLQLAGRAPWPGAIVALIAAMGVAVGGVRAVPDPAAAAKFLDHELDLKEQLATALELRAPSSTQARSPLGAAVQRGAASAAHAASNQWSVRQASAGKEWSITAVLLIVIALIGIAPFAGGGQVRPTSAPLSGGGGASSTASIVPTGPAGAETLAVQVAVVSAPSAGTSSSNKSGAVAVPKARATVVTSGALGQGVGQPSAPTQTPNSASKAVGKATPVTAPHAVPLIQGNQSFLPTSPSAKGKTNGTFTGAPKKSTQSPGPLGSLAGGSSSKGESGPSTNGKGNSAQGKGAAGKGAGTSSAGKQGAGAAQPGNCAIFYGCNTLNPKALAAPGLVTGKGRFTGQGGKGGQTSGHSAGAPIKPSTAKVSAPPSQSKQLTISSTYGSNKNSGARAQQVQGHNGAGTSRQTTVTAGADSGQSVDYVAPDANIQQPSENGIVSRYFGAPTAS